ncbi:hypothetical protein REC12_11820 [Desulfosporosinus sp. PR]|uniref:hypothetical protein n=1 Tax=Candidatus Desulfosporosinus nitrosoreducens TaxID=3401928 RepID=UPI0027FAD130|nr:hypothetical protein [Desulfosporosinus sp. PR]MDQ7094277.1 hypothetical protein [Desulfosporosinus sp. PR]
MTEMEVFDELNLLNIDLDNTLIILRERTRRIENIESKEKVIRECDGLYEAFDRIELAIQKLLSIANDLPTKSISK